MTRKFSVDQTPADYRTLVEKSEVERFCQRTLRRVTVKNNHAGMLAEVLLAADYFGHYSHGLNRLQMYVDDIKNGLTSITNEPEIHREGISYVTINGKNTLGPVVGNFSMDVCIKKAKKTGIGIASAFASNHFGIASWYSLQAAKQNLIGIALTNTSPLMMATRSTDTALGTNPISIAVPGTAKDDCFVLDMATSAVALGKIEVANRKGQPIPHGWAADVYGKSTTVAADGMRGGLMPLGGEEENGGYKGYGLAMMVEVLCGVLANASFGISIRKWGSHTGIANLGQFFLAIDPNAIEPGFQERLSKYVNEMRSLKRIDPNRPVFVPGDPERIHREQVDREGGIRYPQVLVDSVNGLADSLGVPPLKVKRHL